MLKEYAQQEKSGLSWTLMNNFAGVAYCCRNDSDWTMEFISNGCFSLTGYQSSDIIHNKKVSYAKIIHPEDRHLVWNEIQVALREKRPYRIAYRITTVRGEEKWVLEKGGGVFSQEGKLLVLEGIITDITEQKRTEEKIANINKCFLEFGSNPDENINRLTSLCGELLPDTGFVLYKRLDRGMLHVVGKWNMPVDYKLVDKPEGHLCYDMIKYGEDKMLFIRNLGNTLYAKTDSAIVDYNLETYIGCPVKFCGVTISALCLYYKKDFLPSEEDKKFLGIIVSAIGVEEERRLAEDALRESEDLYRTLAEAAHDIIFIVDTNWHIKYVNSFTAKQFELRAQDIVGKPLEELFPSGVSYFQKANLKRVLESSRPFYFEDKIPLGKDNLWLGTWLVPIRNKIGRINSLMGISRDITERKHVEDALRESELKFRALAETTTSGILIFQEDKFVYVNSAVEAASGFSREELLNTNFWDLVHPDYRDIVRERGLARLRGEDVPARYEVKILTKNKEERWLDVSAASMVLEGEPAVVATVLDITERKHAEENLRRSEERYRGLIESQHELIVRANSEGRLTLVNDAYCKKFGKKREEFLGSTFTPLAHNKIEKTIEALKVAPYRVCFEERSLTVSGWRWIAWEAYAIRDDAGNITEIQAVGRDITEEKQTGEELEQRERFLSSVFVSIQDGLSVLDMDFNIIRVNPIMEKMYPHAVPLVGKKCYEAYHGRKERCLACPSYRAIQTKKSAHEIVPKRGPSGETVGWVEVYSFPLVDTVTGRTKGVIEYVRDISERKHAEAEISEWKRRYELIVASSDQLVYEYDILNGNILWGGSLRQVVGYSLEEMSGGIKQWTDMIHPDDRKRAIELLEFSLKDFRPFEAEYRFQKKNGEYIWIHDRGFLTFDSRGKPTRMLGVMQDISERRQVEAELKQSLERLRKDMEGTIQALAITSEIRDPYTSGHERRVAQLACVIAREMNFSDFQIEGIRVAGTLHDIGKISVPAEILSRPGRISEPEFSIIKLHPQVGYEILKNVDFSWPIPQIILQHHERIDGSGYPLGLSGDNIRMEARILGVADVVEAMASHRPYRPALGVEKALEEISEYKGILYDEGVVDVCMQLFIEKGFKFD